MTQQPAYSTPENKYPNTTEGIIFTVEADEEVKEIINSISPELRNAFILIAIKKLKEDSLFGTYFKIKNIDEIKEELENITIPSVEDVGANTPPVNPPLQNNPTQQQNTVQNTQQRNTVQANSFNAW